MNERERLLTVLTGGIADRTPWYADLSWWYDAHKTLSDLNQKYLDDNDDTSLYQSHFQLTPTTGNGYLRLHQDTGAGICFYAPMVWRERFSEEITIFDEKNGPLTRSRIITPVGEIESTSEFLVESHTSAYKTHFVKKPDDLKVMRYLWEHRHIEPAYDDFSRIDRLWGGAGVAAFCLGPISPSPLQTLITRWAGITTTVDILIEAPSLLEETLEALEVADDKIFAAIANSPARIVEFPDNVAGQVTGRNLLRKYVLPYWQKRIRELHASGKIVGVHNDGGVKSALPVIIEAGFDFVEAVTPAPVGDSTLEEIRDITRDKIVVIGGLPGVFFSPLYSKQFFVNFIQEVLSTFPSGEGFVLGVADQVPPDGEFSRICLVKELLTT